MEGHTLPEKRFDIMQETQQLEPQPREHTGDLDFLLVVCPPWDITRPPINIAYLSTYLKSKGFRCDAWDLNIKFFNAVQDTPLGELWNMMSQNTVMPEEMTDRFFEGAQHIVEDFAERILKSGAMHIGFSVHTRNIVFTERMAQMILARDPERVIIYGGPEVAVAYKLGQIPGLTAHAYVLGEGEETLVEALQVHQEKGRFEPLPGLLLVEDGQTTPFEPRRPIKNLDSIPHPTWEEFDLNEYHPYEGIVNLPFLYSRGCIGKCSFCMDHFISGRHRARSAKNAVAEIKHHMKKYGVIYFAFNDLICNGSPKSLGEFCDELIKENLNIFWWSYAVIRKGLTQELFNKMKTSGCLSINFGMESASNHVLKLMNKYYTAEIAEETIRACSRAGIQTSINIIVGFPGETNEDHQDTLDFVKRNKDYINSVVNLGTLMLSPGSPLHMFPENFGVKMEEGRNTWFTDEGLDLTERNRRLEETKQMLETLGIALIIINQEPGLCEAEEEECGTYVEPTVVEPKIRILDVKFFNALDHECREYVPNDFMTVSIKFQVDHPVTDPLFRVQIFNRENAEGDNIFLFGMNTERFNVRMGDMGLGQGEARLILYRLNLMPGKYVVTVGAWPDEMAKAAFDVRHDSYEFVILGRPAPLNAKVLVPVNWVINEQTMGSVGGHNALEYIAFNDHENLSKGCFQTHETLHLHIGVHLAMPQRYSLAASLLHKGYVVHHAVLNEPLPAGRRVVEMVCGPINLLEGHYETAVSLIDKQTGQTTAIQRGTFEIRSRRIEGAGLVFNPCAWNIIRVPRPNPDLSDPEASESTPSKTEDE